METRYAFFKSLEPGDVITSTGCKGVAKKNEEVLTKNREHHKNWGKYARITDTYPEMKQDDEIAGVRWEGIDPSMHDSFVHVAKDEAVPANLRKATKIERKVFLQEYLRTRIEINDHVLEEARDVIKRAQRRNRDLGKIAKEEKIDTGKLLKKKEK